MFFHMFVSPLLFRFIQMSSNSNRGLLMLPSATSHPGSIPPGELFLVFCPAATRHLPFKHHPRLLGCINIIFGILLSLIVNGLNMLLSCVS